MFAIEHNLNDLFDYMNMKSSSLEIVLSFLISFLFA